MNPFKKSTLRAAIAAVAILGLTTSAFARPAVNRVILNCNHEDTLSNLVWGADGVPMVRTMELAVAGAGWGTQMRGFVVCISQDYVFNDGEGSATFKMRDGTGDVLVYTTTEIATWLTPEGPHYAAFGGRYVVDGARSTGRYAGATGEGCIEGWAENDGLPVPVAFSPEGLPTVMKGAGQGYVEMVGTLVLKSSHCARK